MRIKQIFLKNFRAYKEQEIDIDENLNLIIGKNDIGKSTILEALDIFFENSSLEQEDINVNCGKGDEVEIRVIFESNFEEFNLIIDETNPTTLKEEYLLNENGDLEIIQKWKKQDKLKKEVFLKTFAPKIDNQHLITLTIAKLKKIITIKSKDDRKSAELRKAIYKDNKQVEKNHLMY